jgi:chromosome segregation ATPase
VRSPDDLHGPLDARVLVAARARVLSRLQILATDLGRALEPLTALKDRITALRREIEELEHTAPASVGLQVRRQNLAALESQWERETDRIRRTLLARDQLHAEGVRILAATGQGEGRIGQWDALSALVRTRVARLAISPPP